MPLSQFNPGSTSKILNLFLLRFNERSKSENLIGIKKREAVFKNGIKWIAGKDGQLLV